MRDTGGITAGPLALFLLPAGGHACARLTHRALRPQILRELQLTTWRRRERAEERKELHGREDEGAMEWEKPLKSSKALKERRREKSSRFNA
jgi:hypothetical protein